MPLQYLLIGIGGVLILIVIIASAKSASSKPIVNIATLLGSAAYLVWALDAPTALGDGGYIIWTPLAAMAIYCVVWGAAMVGSLFRG